jgi:hypothetical protein
MDDFEDVSNKILPTLHSKEGTGVKIIEALLKINETQEWKVLKELVFDDLVGSLERRLLAEAKKDEPNTMELARLNGQLTWAKKYSDLEKFSNEYRVEIKNIRSKIKEYEQPN